MAPRASQVIDVADWDNSRVQNLLKGWAAGEYFPMAFSRGKVDSEKADPLTLRPVPLSD